MAVIVSMIRGINVGGHNKIKMEELRALYKSLKLQDAQTYVQSGNVIFRTQKQDLISIAKQIRNGIERTLGFPADVILRTSSELREIIATNPFATRRGIDPSKLLILFLAGEPGLEARNAVLRIKTDPEELRIHAREVYIYFPNGIGRTKLSWPVIEKTLKTSGTGRNWNSVTKLLALAEKLENSTEADGLTIRGL